MLDACPSMYGEVWALVCGVTPESARRKVRMSLCMAALSAALGGLQGAGGADEPSRMTAPTAATPPRITAAAMGLRDCHQDPPLFVPGPCKCCLCADGIAETSQTGSG